MIKSKMVNKFVASAGVLSMGIGMLAPTVMAAGAGQEDVTKPENSHVTANIKSGGMNLEVAGNGGEINDTFLGDLVIYDEIAETVTTNLIKVIDRTGAEGWKLSVRADNFADTEKTLAATVKLGADGPTVPLTDTEMVAQSGDSTLNEHTFNGAFNALWGQAPERGDYSSDLTWTLTPKVLTEDAGD